MRLIARSTLLTLAVLAVAPSAEAQFKINIPGVKIPGAFSPDEADRELRRINDVVQSGLQTVPTSFGNHPDSELKQIESAEKKLAEAKKAFGPTLRLGGSNYGVVEKNLVLLTTAITHAKGAQKCSAARRVVTAKQERLLTADAADLKGFADAIAAYKPLVTDADKPILKFFEDELARVTAENLIVEEKARKNMAARLSKEDEEKMKKAGTAANQAMFAIMKEVKDDRRVSDASFANFKKATSDVRAISAGSALFYEHEASLIDLYSAWSLPDGKAQEQIAKKLGGTLVAKGRTTGKKLDVTVKPKGDHCYLMVQQFADRAGTEKIEKFKWQTKGARVQTIGMSWGKDYGVERTEGFCALGPTTVTAEADLVFAGSKNGVRYAVVEIPRNAFPAFVATRMGVSFPDPCDFNHWASYFTKPIPGTFAYLNNEPVIVTWSDSVGGNRDSSYRTVSNRDGTTKKSALSTTAPDSVAFRSQFDFRGCWTESPEGEVSKKLAACYDRIDARYEKDWKQVEALREQAARHGAINLAAEDQASRLKERASEDEQKECGPIYDKAKTEAEKTYTKLVDMLTDKKYVDPLARVELSATEETAPLRRW
jgi:hypothetical protein